MIVAALVVVAAVVVLGGIEPSSPDVRFSRQAEEGQAEAMAPALSCPALIDIDAVAGEPPAESTPAPHARRRVVKDGARHPAAPSGDDERVRLRASAIATELGLDAAGQQALLDVLAQEQSRRAAAFEELRNASDQDAARDHARRELNAVVAWKTRTLQARFGHERAAAMLRRR